MFGIFPEIKGQPLFPAIIDAKSAKKSKKENTEDVATPAGADTANPAAAARSSGSQSGPQAG